MSGTPEQPMSYRRALLAFGNGDMGRGQQNLFMLARRLEWAREKHPEWGEGAVEALAVIGEEYNELGAPWPMRRRTASLTRRWTWLAQPCGM